MHVPTWESQMFFKNMSLHGNPCSHVGKIQCFHYVTPCSLMGTHVPLMGNTKLSFPIGNVLSHKGTYVLLFPQNNVCPYMFPNMGYMCLCICLGNFGPQVLINVGQLPHCKINFKIPIRHIQSKFPTNIYALKNFSNLFVTSNMDTNVIFIF